MRLEIHARIPYFHDLMKTSEICGNQMTDLKPYPSEKAEQMDKLQSLWADHCAVERQGAACAGGVQWKPVKGKDYLIHYFNDTETGKRRFVSKGPRSPETEQWRERFLRNQKSYQIHEERLNVRLKSAAAVAKALKLGRAPVVVGELFRALQRSAIWNSVTLTGSFALLAYEVQARMTVASDVLTAPETRADLDLFVGDEETLDVLENVLKSVDREFRRDGCGSRRFVGANLVVDCYTEADLEAISEQNYGGRAGEFIEAATALPADGYIVDRSGMIAPVRAVAVENFRFLKALRCAHDPLRDDEGRLLDEKQAEVARKLARVLNPNSRDTGAEFEDDEYKWSGRLACP